MVPVSFTFPFCGDEFVLTRANALYWPRERALLVADLHLEKASFFARHGQMLPPYDSRETLGRLADAVREFDARRVFTLGDNFHDAEGASRLEEHAAGMLDSLTRATDWVWITGNHDHGETMGTTVTELEVGGVLLRHEAVPGDTRPELSGHFHPKIRLRLRERNVARACAVVSEHKLIMPAFGALTGGMDAADPAIIKALQPARAVDALVPTAKKLARLPLWREAA